MSNNNYVQRENFIAEVYHNENDDELLNTTEILKDKYDYICKSINDEGYTLENPECNLFKELLYDDMVVGFVTYDYTKGVGDFSLNEIYVLPEYRGNKYFISELEYMMLSGSTVSIYEPTHRIIEILMENNLARNIVDNLVVSSISLDINQDKSECTVSNHEWKDDIIHSCNLYDLNISACILPENISDKDTNIIHYSRCLADDNKHYSADSIRENIDNDYFENIKNSIIENHEEYVATLMELEDNKPTADFDIDEIVGRPPNLSGYLEELIAEEFVTRQRALEIQAQMIEEYDEGLILSESLLKRLEYLSMEDLINEDKMAEGFDSSEFDMKCPYCEFPITLIDKTCEVCGLRLDNDELLEYAIFDEMTKDIVENIEEMRRNGLSDEEILEITKVFGDDLSSGYSNGEELKKMLEEIVENELNK